MTGITVESISEEILTHLDDVRFLKLASQFGLDAPERIQLITQILLLKEAREQTQLLDGIRSMLINDILPGFDEPQLDKFGGTRG